MSTAPALAALHLALTIALFIGAALPTVRPQAARQAARVARASVLLLAATLPLQLAASGWWVDMTVGRIHAALAALAAIALFGPGQSARRLATLALAGFYLGLGALSIRNATPLPPFLSAKSLLLGGLLLLVSAQSATPGRAERAAIVALLLVAGATGALGEIPLP